MYVFTPDSTIEAMATLDYRERGRGSRRVWVRRVRRIHAVCMSLRSIGSGRHLSNVKASELRWSSALSIYFIPSLRSNTITTRELLD